MTCQMGLQNKCEMETACFKHVHVWSVHTILERIGYKMKVNISELLCSYVSMWAEE